MNRLLASRPAGGLLRAAFVWLAVAATSGRTTAQQPQTLAPQGHPPAERRWTDRTGKFSVRAELVDWKDHRIRLRKGSGTIVSVPLERLSVPDREFLRNVVWADGQAAPAAENLKASYRQAKAAMLQQLRSGEPDDRITALRHLGDYPLEEVAKTVLDRAVGDADPLVRSAAVETLLQFRNSPRLCWLTLATVKRHLGRPNPVDVLCPMLVTVLASELPAARREVLGFVDGQLAIPGPGRVLVGELLEGLGNRGDPTALEALNVLARSGSFTANFAFRRKLVQAVIQIQLPEAVAALIEMLPLLRGEVRADIVRHLRASTGKDFGTNGQAWLEWWNGRKEAFQFPQKAYSLSNGEASQQGTSSYYGIPIYAQRMVFVLDRSGSMSGSRLATAKRELIGAINGLPPDSHFTIVFYNDTVRVWQRQLVPANPPIKAAAARFVLAQEAKQQTASYDALEAGFRFDVEAVFFLSDGDPNRGKITNRDEIVAAITAMNKHRMISVHVIGIAPRQPGGKFDQFLEALAENNFGVYRRVGN